MTTENKQRSPSSAFGNDSELRQRRPQAPTNKTTRNVKDAVILAAEAVGEDGRGHNGLVGYLKNAAVEEPKAYLQLLGKILPMPNIEVNNQPVRYVDEIPPEERRRTYYEEMRRIKLGHPPSIVCRDWEKNKIDPAANRAALAEQSQKTEQNQ